ncbi:MAG: response regulator [Elusimicrobiota bacterium]|jgi:two-component system cell cycle response regulator DivK
MPALIMIADDDMDNRTIMAAALTAAGFRVCLAENGAQALESAAQQHPDLILLDMSMPIMDGWTAVGRLKADPALRAIPVWALTAFALSGDEAKTKAAGCDAYLSKPCIPAELVSRVRQALNPGGTK